jgi:DNA-nicking Smr family endonuclease
MWLASAEMRPFVVGFGEAGPAHGGAGALYVRIRRGRPGAR